MLKFQKSTFAEAADHLLQIVVKSRIEKRLLLENVTVDRDFLVLLREYAYCIDIAG